MKRFAAKADNARTAVRSIVFPVALFLALLLFFFYTVGSLGNTAASEQEKTIEQAVVRAAVNCYAVEGAYPQDIAYLEDHYGLTIDKEKYRIDYQCFASNIMPQIVVVKL